MTTSDYLKVQADILIAYDLLRRARIEEFVAKARELAEAGAELPDRDGRPVVTDSVRMHRLATAAIAFVAAGGRKPAASESAPLARKVAV